MTRIRAARASGAPPVKRRLTRVGRAAVLALTALTAAFATYHLAELAPERAPATAANEAPTVRAPATPASEAAPVRAYRHADFSGEHASTQARGIADWVVDSGDNAGMPFVIVDKIDARLFVFDAAGHLTGASVALLGSARGDDTTPGIGDKKLSQISPGERTTPAGRFVGERGVNLKNEEIVWVDYDAAVSIHAVRANNAKERRLQRLASPASADNRISYGCINVPSDFFRTALAPLFRRTRAIIYVLPETRPTRVVFNSYDVPPVSAADAPAALALSAREEWNRARTPGPDSFPR